jgi:hypothetical protein
MTQGIRQVYYHLFVQTLHGYFMLFLVRIIFLLKYPDVIDNHMLGENSGNIRTTRPVSTNSYIKYEKEILTEFTHVGRRSIDNMKLNIIYIPHNGVGIPDN